MPPPTAVKRAETVRFRSPPPPLPSDDRIGRRKRKPVERPGRAEFRSAGHRDVHVLHRGDRSRLVDAEHRHDARRSATGSPASAARSSASHSAAAIAWKLTRRPAAGGTSDRGPGRRGAHRRAPEEVGVPSARSRETLDGGLLPSDGNGTGWCRTRGAARNAAASRSSHPGRRDKERVPRVNPIM